MAAISFPAAYGAVPSPRQLAWHQLEIYGFIHFSINTFTGKEWGYGDESPALFNPTAFDADQIARVAKAAGLRGLVLTCKHHDGFCLWPSQYTDHSVKNSPWKEGKGDLVREISEACARHDLLFGVYLSPWDRNRADYGTPQYLEYYRAQLRELLTNYGPIFEMWFDGANGGDGFYGGARETRTIDNQTYYDWDNTWQIVRDLQPDACIFTDKGPDIRWVGNEAGFAGDPCWSTLSTDGIWPGNADHAYLNRGERQGPQWLPAEVDVSTRPGWFYHASEDNAVKSVTHLRQIYFESVGRGASLILNIPPDRRGQIHENDVASLLAWRRHLQTTFALDLAQGATISTSNTRGNDAQFAPAQLLDNCRETFWTSDDDVLTPHLILNLGAPTTFNVVCLREYLPLGQRVDSFALDAWQDENWQEFAAAQSIGNCRLIAVPDITTTQIRLRITAAAACPALSEFGLFLMPKILEAPKIERDRDGLVTIRGAASEAETASELRYSLDGAAPDAASALYEAPFALPAGGTVKARAFSPDEITEGEIATATFGVSKRAWKVLIPASDESFSSLLDENPATLWTSDASDLPVEIVISLGETLALRGFTFLPRQDGKLNGTPDRYEFYVGSDGENWGAPVASGEFSNLRANPTLQTKIFDQAVTGAFFRFVGLRTLDNSVPMTCAEISVIALQK